MKEVLNKLEENYNLSGEDSAFEILSGIVIFKKSAEYIFSKDWLKCKQHTGKYCNSSNDGKIDLIDIYTNDREESIYISFMQVENSSSMGSGKIRLFVMSASEYLIDFNKIIDDEYSDLKNYQKIIKDIKKTKHNYKIYYNFYISYNGKYNENCEKKLKQCVESLGLPNTRCEVFNKDKLHEGLQEIINISNNPIDVEYNIKSTDGLIECNNNKFKSVTMLIDSNEIFKMINYEQEKNIELNRLFNNNVRGFLEQSDLNNKIKETIECYSDSFYYCNNGATIFCDDIIRQSNDEVHVINPRIINGQQSIASIYLYDEKKNTKILTKLIATNNDEDRNSMMNLLCLTTNSSNQIKPANLISNSRLIVKTKDFFNKNGINLSIKEGNLLNSIFTINTDIDLEELLKIWVTLFLKRPDLAKNKGRVFQMFYKSELDEEKYKIFKNDKAIDILVDEFFKSYKFYKIIEEKLLSLKEKEYFSHGKYVIVFMIYDKYGINPNASLIDTNNISKKLEKYINIYKQELTKKGKTFSLNNYFKGTRPLSDLNIIKKSEIDYIKELEKRI